MARIKYSDSDIRNFGCSLEGQAYLEYNEAVGGEPLGLTVPFGHPKGVEQMGGVIAVYKECIREGKTWKNCLELNPFLKMLMYDDG